MKKIILLSIIAVLSLLIVSSCGETVSTETTGSSVESSTGDSQSGSDSTASTGSSSTTDSTTQSGTTDSSAQGTVDSSSQSGTTASSDTTSSSDDKAEDTVITSAPSLETIVGPHMGVFNTAGSYGDESKFMGYTSYTNEYDLSKYAGKQILITAGGRYLFSGKSINTQIFIKPSAADQNITIVLNGVDISYAGSGPVIYAEKCGSVLIATMPNTVNTLTDNSKNGENGVIKVKSCDLTMDGKGKLILNANSKNGISNTKVLTIKGGEYEITAQGHGIYGKLGVVINGGKFNFKCAKSGIKAGDNEANSVVEGDITINSGNFKIVAGTNGLNACGAVSINKGWIYIESGTRGIDAKKLVSIKSGIITIDADADAIKTSGDVVVSGDANLKINTNGNGIEAQNLTVNTSGVIYIKTSAVYIEAVDGEFKKIDGEYVPVDGTEKPTVKKYNRVECKGFEAKSLLKVSKGIIGIDSFEDCMNACNVEIEGGTIAIATTKDGIEASENVKITNTTNGAPTVYICSSDKGIKATGTVSLLNGSTIILAKTDAIKADTLTVNGGKHILYEKVECATAFKIAGGTFISIATTKAPVIAKATIPNVYGAIENKKLCVAGETIVLTMGEGQSFVSETLVLFKDYSDKMSVFYAAECSGKGTIEIGEDMVKEELTKGKFY